MDFYYGNGYLSHLSVSERTAEMMHAQEGPFMSNTNKNIEKSYENKVPLQDSKF